MRAPCAASCVGAHFVSVAAKTSQRCICKDANRHEWSRAGGERAGTRGTETVHASVRAHLARLGCACAFGRPRVREREWARNLQK
eukprot:6213618-Pleurochrysis_carterae.AAC.2